VKQEIHGKKKQYLAKRAWGGGELRRGSETVRIKKPRKLNKAPEESEATEDL